MNILFAGTPDIAVPCLGALVAAGHTVEVLTNPDAPTGRSSTPTPPPVKVRALELGLAVHQPPKLDGAARAPLEGRFDLLVSFAYGRIFGPLFLGLFPQGGLNVHPSLLPRWRGPSPLSAAIAAGDSQTGISVQRLALEMDRGDVVIRVFRTLDGTETTGSLTAWAAETAPAVLVEAVASLAAGTVRPQAQNDAEATYCSLVKKDDGVLDWSRSAVLLDAQIRACDPWPGASTLWKGLRLGLRQSSVVAGDSGLPPGSVVAVDKSNGILIQTGEARLAIRELQLPGRKSLDFRSFLNGNPSLVGSRLGEPS